MIFELLRRLPQFRAVERECQELRDSLQQLTTEKLLLQDRLDATLSDRANLWELVQESLKSERNALRMQVNFSTQQHFGVVPYPDESQIPAAMTREFDGSSTIPRRPTGAEAVAAQTQKFIEGLRNRIIAKTAGPVKQ